MLGFYLDSNLTLACTQATPKKVAVPLVGGDKVTTIYLGDPYTGTVTQVATSASTVLDLDQTNEFLSAGHAAIGGTTFTYTGVTATSLTGVSGLPASVPVGTLVKPAKKWVAGASIQIASYGTDLATLGISMRPTGTQAFNFAGMPLLLTTSSLLTTNGAQGIDLQVLVPGGTLEEFTNWFLITNAFYAQDLPNNTVPDGSTPGVSPQLFGYAIRRDQQLPITERLLPANRAVTPNLPGFVYGTYRWRDSSQINEQTLLPTDWNVDVAAIGDQNFVAGIGFGDDLEPIELVQDSDSIYIKVGRGFYFTGPNGYFWPGTPQLDFIPSFSTTLQLSQLPTEIYPVFVGTYRLDSQGFYEKDTEYQYMTPQQVASGVEVPPLYYTLNRRQGVVTLNKPMPPTTYYLGTISGEATDYFDIPVYPVDRVLRVYVSFTAGDDLPAVNWTFDRDLGTITVTNPSGTGPSIPGAIQGQAILIDTEPALAVLYETAEVTERIVDSVDLNPAFSGLSSGYVYLMHSRQEPASLILSCDKPQIDIPPTYASIIGLVAYGPVYFQGDYSLLQITAYSGVAGQTVPNVVLRSVVDPTTFTGTLNYQDPTVAPVEITTGADGIANVIFQPQTNFGLYIPKQAPISNGSGGLLAGISETAFGHASDTINLPSPGIAISQLWNPDEGWLTKVYIINNNNPLLGMVGANTALGEVLFVTSGTPGAFNYKMNGELVPWLNSQDFLLPINAWDFNGTAYTSPGFTGMVARMQFAQDISYTDLPQVAGYFLSYVQRTLLRFEAVDTNIESNSILLQMQMPEIIDDNLWLTFNNFPDGIINQNRLGWVATVSSSPFS